MNLSKSREYFDPSTLKGRVHIIGCGSVGSTLAELMARAGVTKLTLWDFDKVESHNIANQMFFERDIGRLKVDAVADMVLKINSLAEEDIRVKEKGWRGERLSGYVFLAVDSIETRRKIVESHMNSTTIKAVFDIRTRLEDAQHYACDWKDVKGKQGFLESMNFTHEEAMQETPMSACNVVLSVAPTIRVICSLAMSNFMNFVNGKELKKLVICNPFVMDLLAC